MDYAAPYRKIYCLYGENTMLYLIVQQIIFRCIRKNIYKEELDAEAITDFFSAV